MKRNEQIICMDGWLNDIHLLRIYVFLRGINNTLLLSLYYIYLDALKMRQHPDNT
jgi:hypothetical protein